MKVLLVHNSYQQPGGEDVVFEQERRMLERAGHQVVVYHRSNHELDEASLVGRLTLAPKVIWSADTRREFAEILLREKPQVIHIHNTFMMISPSVYSACREARVPVVQTLHNYRLLCPAATFFRQGRVCEECLEHSLWRGVRHGCYRDSRAQTAVVALMLAVHRRRNTWAKEVNYFIALSEFSRGKFIEAGIAADKIGVKPNFVHPDPGERLDIGKYALFVGRLSPEKGSDTLLAAWKLLHRRIPLMVVGDGPLSTLFAAGADQRGPGNISLRGRLTRDQTRQAIKGASFLILPSGCYENFPMSVVEAFACGVPVICSRLGAMPEIVADTRTGLYFTPGDPEDLARKVEWAWTHPEQMAGMGKEARREYEAKYTAESNYRMLMDIYQDALASHTQPDDSSASSRRS
jgi:glycosyltransferase involved in cell wall biosynthesis